MKRVLIFSLNYYPFVGGAEVAIKEITDRIAAEEIEFHLIAPRYDVALPKEEQVGNVRVYRIGLAASNPSMEDLKRRPLNLNKKLYQLLAVLKAEQLHRRYRYDGVWAMIAHSCAIPAGIFKRFHPRVKYLLTLQEGDPPEYIERLMRPVMPLFRQGFARADALQAISAFLLRWGTRMGFAGVGVVIPNGVDLGRFGKTVTPAERAQARAELGAKDRDVLLVTASRLVHKNGLDSVIDALARMPERTRFVVFGVGPDARMLAARAKEKGVAARVDFRGQASHEELARLLAACDIFIRPSRSEGMGNSFIEAMAAGLPVIATQEGGIADFLFDAARDPGKEPTGWAVDADAPEQIAQAVEAILADPARTARTVASAKAMVTERYSWDLVARQMQDLFRKLLVE